MTEKISGTDASGKELLGIAHSAISGRIISVAKDH
jgi:hypothetical protein